LASLLGFYVAKWLESNYNTLELNNQERKMTVVKICNKHGELNEEQIRKYIRNRRGRSEETIACKLCHRETAGRARNSDRTRANEWEREQRKKFPEKYKKYEQNYIEKHGIEKVRKMEVARIHGLTVAEYDALHEKQNGLCEICGKPEKRLSRTKGDKMPLCLDHCHTCKEKGHHIIRGLLCHNCNSAMGKLHDNIDILKSMISYLERHNHFMDDSAGVNHEQ